MAKLEDQSNKHEYRLLRTQTQPNAGWGALCEDCLFIAVDRTNSDFPCKKWGTAYPPFPNLLRYSNTGVDVIINEVMNVDFVEICLAYKRRERHMTNIRTLGDELPKQQARVRELLIAYREIGSGGVIAADFLERVLNKAAKAILSGDVAEMIVSYNELKGCE